MSVDINNKALRGSISQIILNALLSGDKYGYEICKDIEQKTNGTLILKQPSLYSSLRRMEEQGLISSYWGDSDIGGRRHYYKISDKGKSHYEKNSVNWEDFNHLLSALNPTTQADESINQINTDIDNITKNINELKESNSSVDNLVNTDIFMHGVVKQEDLFSIATPPKIEEKPDTTPQDEQGVNFIQFDMFNQNANFVKSTNDDLPPVTSFKNKYANNDLHKTSIEPVESSIIKKYDKIGIADLDNIKNNYNSFSNSTQKQEDTYNEFFNSDGFDDIFNKDFSKLNDIIQDEKPYQLQNQNNQIVDDFTNTVTDDNKNEDLNNNQDINNNEIEEETIFIKKNSDNNNYQYIESQNIKSDDEQYNDKKQTDAPQQEEQILHKSLQDYDEVLKPDEYVDMHHTDGIDKYNRPDEYNPIKYSSSNYNSKSIIQQKQDTSSNDIDYKNILGELYSNINRTDPYEKQFDQNLEISEQLTSVNKNSNEALFETEPANEKQTMSTFSQTKNDLDMLATQFRQEGIKFRTYNKSVYSAKQGDNYINYNKLRLCQGWFVWLFMIIEILAVGLGLNYSNLLPTPQLTLYYWAFGLSFIYPIILTIAYFIDPYKKTTSNFKLSINLFNKFLAILITIVFIFAINLFLGMTSLNQLDFLSYWLLPTILCSNYMISTLIYIILLKSKKFHV